MNSEEHLKGVQSHSSSVQSTPEKDGHLDYTLRASEVLQSFLKSGPKRELLKTCVEKEKKIKTSLKSRMADQQLKPCNKNLKNPENRKAASSSNPASRKQSRKGENPVRFIPTMEQSSGFGGSTTWICKNSACRATLSMDDVFCRRCSCCICHKFDDNKDPSLWLVCESESSLIESCGLSCHIECALKKEKVGVMRLGQYMELDGSYCCAACGKVSGILECWKKQLAIAKHARRVDMLCHRVFLSYRLLDGTSRFKELHEIVSEAKTKLEAELGPMNGEFDDMARGIVSRLAIASDVQKLCSKAIDKAEEWRPKSPSIAPVGSLPAACRFLFEEVTSSSLIIVLIDVPSPFTNSIKGYKLWYWKSGETFSEYPGSDISRENRRISVTSLQPCTEYTFRVMSYTEAGDLGHSEAKCYTKSIELFKKKPSSAGHKEYPAADAVEGRSLKGKELYSDKAGSSSDFQVRNLNKIFHSGWEPAQVGGIRSAEVRQFCDVTKLESPKKPQSPPVPRKLDLNVVSVPDLNEDLTPPLESSRDEDNGLTLERGTGPDDDAASHDIEKNGLARSNGSGPSDDSQAWALTRFGDVPAVDSLLGRGLKRPSSAIEETLDCDSTLISGSSFRLSDGPGTLDENYEDCVKVIRDLERKALLKPLFRLKFLTWFSLRSTEQERRVVNTFIRTICDDPKSLAGQLVDSFADIISRKRPRNSVTSIAS